MKKFLLILFISFIMVVGFAESKNALLIANSKYSNFGTLATPVNEARQLKNALSQIGFNVTILENANRVQMQDAIDDFSVKVKSVGGIGLFHYGGHAVQVNGKNYLIPIDANIPSQNKVASRSIDVDDIMASMNADSNIVILDSCRDNPLPAESRSSGTRGLALTDIKTKNSIIVYSADSGNTAQDGVFTPSLIKHITDKKEFTQILREVRNEVRTKTNGKQNPSSYDQLSNDIYLAGMPSVNQTSIASNQSNEEIERLKRELEKLKNNSSKTTQLTKNSEVKEISNNINNEIKQPESIDGSFEYDVNFYTKNETLKCKVYRKTTNGGESISMSVISPPYKGTRFLYADDKVNKGYWVYFRSLGSVSRISERERNHKMLSTSLTFGDITNIFSTNKIGDTTIECVYVGNSVPESVFTNAYLSTGIIK